MSFWQFAGKLLISTIFISNATYATILPHDYSLRERTEQTDQIIDPKFEAWLALYSNLEPIQDIGSKNDGLAKRLKTLDPVEASYAQFLLVQGNNRKKQLVKADMIKEELKKYKVANKGNHPLTPYILNDLHQIGASSIDENSYYQTLRSDYKSSCVHKQYVESKLSSPAYLNTAEVSEIHEMLVDAATFESYRDRTSFLPRLLTHLPEDKRNNVKSDLAELVKENSYFKTKYPWVFDDGTISVESKTEQAVDEIWVAIRKNRCTEAKAKIVSLIINDKTNLDYDDTFQKVRKIADCFKSFGAQKRIQFSEELLPMMEKKFGPKSRLQLNLLIARYEWNVDNNEKAINLLKVNVETPHVKELKQEIADSIMLIAKIYENQGDTELSKEYFERFAKDYPQDERASEAISSLVLFQVLKNDWQSVISLANKIIIPQDDLPISDRDSSNLGFALFWKGRAEFELSQRDYALMTWKRLATEFYSTYYGALGHYLLELQQNKRWIIRSVGAAEFSEDLIFKSFSQGERERVNRVKSLLKLGRQEDAACEIVEFKIENSEEKTLASALLKHAAGDWLPSIKLFANLSREYRNTLPRGMEMMLFPKRYEEEIIQYSDKLKLDPDLVYALIRQESVFNPNARSSAGAKGLMQLMSSTASLEAKKIKNTYVSNKVRKKVLNRTKNENNLFDHDLNLLLGVHHLDSLLSDWNESPVLTLSAYNAGPGAAQRWVKQIPTNDVLYFIEKIPFGETRQYVKLIMRNYFYYKYWYGDKEQKLPYLEKITSGLTSSNKWN